MNLGSRHTAVSDNIGVTGDNDPSAAYGHREADGESSGETDPSNAGRSLYL
jgi:hypothetical protein